MARLQADTPATATLFHSQFELGASLTANQYRAALKKLGLSQRGAARLLGVDERTSRKWAENGVSGTATILLRLMLAGKVSAAEIEAARK